LALSASVGTRRSGRARIEVAVNYESAPKHVEAAPALRRTPDGGAPAPAETALVNSASRRKTVMKKTLEIGGFISGAILIAFGVAVIALGANGRSTVNSNLKQEQITGTPDMTPALIKQEATKAGLTNVGYPTCSVAGKAITNGSTARCFAQYMRIHALEATGGVPYALMPRYATADGKGTNDATKALQSNGRPVDNAARNIWVTETALTTALNVSYMATQLSLFSIVIGAALLLTGIGFVVLDWAALHRRREQTAGERAVVPTRRAAIA
jgi:hypothetical protein